MDFREISDKIWDGRGLSGGELDGLARLLSSNDGKRAFENMLADRWASFEPDAEFDHRPLLAKVKAAAGNFYGVKKQKSFLNRIIPAAAAVAAILAGTWLYISGAFNDASATISVVSDNIELILPGGECFILNAPGVSGDLEQKGFVLDGAAETGKSRKLRYVAADGAAEGKEPLLITLKVPKGEDYTIDLPDGTTVYLNSESTFRFPVRFQSGSREVHLSGEAAFSVAGDGGSTFNVHAGERSVVVTGTRFNVSAYGDDPFWETVLVEGAVEIVGDGRTVHMKPRQRFLLDRESGGERLQDIVSEEAVFAPWAAGTMSFRSLACEDISRKLSRWYDFEIAYADPGIRHMKFTGTVSRDEPLEAFLSLLEETTNVKFTIKGKCITADTRRTE